MSIDKDKFYKKYNHLQMDKYLSESKKIKDKDRKIIFWCDLLNNYKKDLNELNNINFTFGLSIVVDEEYRYKKGGLFSATFETFCKNQIEQLENETLKTVDPKTKDRVYKKIALTTFFKVSNKVLDPEPIDKPIFINYGNWHDLKEQFFEQRIKSYDSSLSLEEKTKLETDYINKLVSINENETILNPKEDQLFKILVGRYKELLSEPKKETKTKIKFDPNQFNEDGAKLFNYLVENYIKTEKTRGLQKRFTNVWHFMRNDNHKNNIYNFYFTKNQYKAYVLNKFNLKITNDDKSGNKYNEVDLVQLKNHVLIFEDLYKS